MSLEICWGVTKEIKIPNVPTSKDERVELTLRPRDSDGFGLVVDPWPFCTARVSVRAEGKRLRGLFATHEELIRTLDAADPVLVTTARGWNRTGTL